MLGAVATIALVLDCRDPERLAAFWGPALGYQRLGATGSYVVLGPSERGRPALVLQRVPEPKADKNRMHIDFHRRDIEAEARRLEAVGATRTAAEPRREHGVNWFLMADPEGNEFCVCDGGANAAPGELDWLSAGDSSPVAR